MNWKFDRDGNALPTTIKEQRQKYKSIPLKDNANSSILNISLKDATESHKSLGCYTTNIRQ